MVGAEGSVWRSTNGGVTWSKQNTPTFNRLLDVQFLDANNGWAVGKLGTELSKTICNTAI